MTKYRLKKWYPTLPNHISEGFIVEWHGKGGSDYIASEKVRGGLSLPKCEVENNPEFWEEVVDKNYKVISIKRDDGKTFKNKGFLSDGEVVLFDDDRDTYMTEDLSGLTNYYIHSVKRLSDGEVFTVGDDIKTANGKPDIIESFYTECDYFWVRTSESGSWNIKKIEPLDLPLFTTEDGVDIYPNDDVYWVRTDNDMAELEPEFSIGKYQWDGVRAQSSYKWFSTKEAANKWVEYNKPKYSEADIREAIKDSEVIKNHQLYIPKFKSKLNL